jgi:hypothetical protein
LGDVFVGEKGQMCEHVLVYLLREGKMNIGLFLWLLSPLSLVYLISCSESINNRLVGEEGDGILSR